MSEFSKTYPDVDWRADAEEYLTRVAEYIEERYDVEFDPSVWDGLRAPTLTGVYTKRNWFGHKKLKFLTLKWAPSSWWDPTGLCCRVTAHFEGFWLIGGYELLTKGNVDSILEKEGVPKR